MRLQRVWSLAVVGAAFLGACGESPAPAPAEDDVEEAAGPSARDDAFARISAAITARGAAGAAAAREAGQPALLLFAASW